jgi:Phosphoesterase family
MPGPTWPNRFFIHAASSGGLDDGPSPVKQAKAMLIDGYDFKNGTIFDRLDARGIAWRIFQGDEFPVSRAIGGLDDNRFFDFVQFAAAVNDPNYDAGYTFIEPNGSVSFSVCGPVFLCGEVFGFRPEGALLFASGIAAVFGEISFLEGARRATGKKEIFPPSLYHPPTLRIHYFFCASF